MTHLSSNQWKINLLTITPLLVSLACLTVTSVPSTATPESGAVSVESNVDFGPGAFDFPDAEAGLAGLSSYKATLTVAFDGTESGQSQRWSKTYVMLATKEPSAHQLAIQKTGANSDPAQAFMAEMDAVAYEQRGEDACSATMIIEERDSLTERLEPAGFLNGVIGAEEAGNETVNDVAANHYTFDESAFGQLDIAESTGEMWIASDGGYIVRYLLTTKGTADYFGEGIEGTLTWDYELTDINQAVTFELPDDCPAGIVNVPLLPDASNILNMPGILTYDTSTSVADIVAFYQQEIPNMGWELVGEPTITDTTALLDFMQGDQTMAILITTGDTGTTVHVVLGDSQE